MAERGPHENRLLAALPAGEYDRIRARLEPVRLAIREDVVQVDTPIPYLYFPESAVLSMVLMMGGGEVVEIATMGREGMSGIPVFLGAERSPARIFCQVPGEALRMEVGSFRDEIGRGGALHDLIRRYALTMFNQIVQTSACNRLHTVEQRLCRWLLMTRDRIESDHLPLTQEFLALMLGVKRPSVSIVAAVLQKAGLIHYVRGKVDILDVEGLEATACECYQVVKREFDRLFG